MKGVGHTHVTGEDIKSPYYAKSTDRPTNPISNTPHAVHAVPPKKTVKKQRTSGTLRMTQLNNEEGVWFVCIIHK